MGSTIEMPAWIVWYLAGAMSMLALLWAYASIMGHGEEDQEP